MGLRFREGRFRNQGFGLWSFLESSGAHDLSWTLEQIPSANLLYPRPTKRTCALKHVNYSPKVFMVF